MLVFHTHTCLLIACLHAHCMLAHPYLHCVLAECPCVCVSVSVEVSVYVVRMWWKCQCVSVSVEVSVFNGFSGRTLRNAFGKNTNFEGKCSVLIQKIFVLRTNELFLWL